MNVMSPPANIPEERPQSSSSSVTSTRRKRRFVQDEPINVALNRLENLSSAINMPTEHDEFYYFGHNIAAQLRSLPLYEALNVQTEIQNIVIAARRRQQCQNLSEVSQRNSFYTPYTQTLTTNSVLHTTLPTTLISDTQMHTRNSFYTLSPYTQTITTNSVSNTPLQTAISTSDTQMINIPINTDTVSQQQDVLSQAWNLS